MLSVRGWQRIGLATFEPYRGADFVNVNHKEAGIFPPNFAVSYCAGTGAELGVDHEFRSHRARLSVAGTLVGG